MYSHAKCDLSGKSIPINMGSLVADTQTGKWYFCQYELADQIQNNFRWDGAGDVNDQLSLFKLLAGLSVKSWFVPDLFFDKIKTFY